MNKVIVTVLNPTYIHLNKYGVSLFTDKLSYTAVYYQKLGHRKIRKEYQKSMIQRNGNTYLGFFTRIKEFCEKNEIKLEVEDEFSLLSVTQKGKINRIALKGKTLREDQKQLVHSVIKNERGVLKAPTGTGKTVMIMGILSSYPKKMKWLIFVPNISLLTQTAKELEDHDFEGILTLGGKTSHKMYSTNDLFCASIILTTSSSFLNLLEDRKESNWHDCLDGAIIDECHIGMKPDGRFDKILKKIFVPIRIGLTATLPNDSDARFCLEGLVGPVISEMTLKEGEKLNLLAKPKIKLISVPRRSQLATIKDYHTIVDQCLINNSDRNSLLVQAAKQLQKRKLSVIIFVTKIEHGEVLQEQLEKAGVPNLFIQGSTEGMDREKIRQRMTAKQVQCVIATVVWREGINIPSLNAAIIAGGGKTTSGILQSIGRTLRRTEKKKKALIIDFLDPYRYLAEHTVERVGIYSEQKWI